MARESKRLKRELDVKEEQMQSLEGYVQKLHDSGYIDSEGHPLQEQQQQPLQFSQ